LTTLLVRKIISMTKSIWFLIPALIFVSCTNKNVLTPEELKIYQAEIDAWHVQRLEKVKAPNGWLNLVGLYWLKSGMNTFGSGENNNIVFPKGKIAEQAGYFLVKGNVVDIHINDGVSIAINGNPVAEQTIFHPDSTKTIILKSGSLRWNIIKRDSELGIRLRDDESETIKSFSGIERFPVDPEYRVEATFEKSDSSRTIEITNVLDQTTPQRSPGSIVFEIKGTQYRLDVLEGGKEEYFVIVSDATSGKETYAGGRFMYVKHPDISEKIIVDFNKAYNPPCVFTPYATCPLPPAQNVLPVEIKAGEKVYEYNSEVAVD